MAGFRSGISRYGAGRFHPDPLAARRIAMTSRARAVAATSALLAVAERGDK